MNARYLWPALAAASLTGCGDQSATDLLVTLGLLDPPSPADEQVAVLCDPSPGSSCTPEVLDTVLEAALGHLADRPGSTLSIYMLGATVAETRLAARETLAEPPPVRARDREAFRERQLEDLRTALLEAAQGAWEDEPIRASPLLESVTKLAALESGMDHLVVISDGLEESAVGRWECGVLPDSAGLAQILERERLLQPTSLAGTVTFAFRTLDGIDRDRCPLSLARVAQVESLWTQALQAAGARRVAFTADAPDLDSLHKVQPTTDGGQP